jgi:hypothetical protein
MASVLGDKKFWQAASEKSVMTFSQTLAAELVVFSVPDLRDQGLDGLPWTAMLTVAVIAALVSFLTSVGKGSVGVVGPGTVLETQAANGGGDKSNGDGGAHAKGPAV